MFSIREYRKSSRRLPDLLPWAALVGPGVILQKDGVLQRTIAFRGPDLASSSPTELVAAAGRLNNALMRLGTGWSLFIEAQRFESSRYPGGRWHHLAPYLLDVERRTIFSQAGAHFESSYFCTFVWRLPAASQKRLQALFYHDPQNSAAHDNERDMKHFDKTTSEIVDIMAGVFPDVGYLDDDQTLSYLHSTISTNRHPVRAPETPMYLDALLPDQAFTPGDIPLLGDHFVATCTVSGFPGTSTPGILDHLNHLMLEYRWVTRYICLDRPQAQTELEKYRKRWWAKRKNLLTLLKEEAAKQESALVDNAAANKATDADAALQELGDDLVGFGYLTTTVTVWDRNLEIVRRKMANIKQLIQARGFTVRDETLNSQDAWLGSLPGHVYGNVRRPIISTLNLAHLFPCSAVWAGDDYDDHLRDLTGASLPLVYASTTGGTPFRLNLNIGDVGHTIVVGPTGAGKSTFLGLIELQWLKYPRSQVIIFDKGRSALAATLAVGGAYYEPGNEDAPVSFQPLARIDSRDERIWAAEFILTLLQLQGVSETPTIKSAIDGALVSLSSAKDREQRTLTVFAAILGSFQNELREALRPYTQEGNYGQIFDADHDDLAHSFWTCFEMGHLMSKGEEVIIPALAYLFHRVEARFSNETPTLLVLDEAWLFLGHPVFAARLQAWLKTLRKLGVYVCFATQEFADLVREDRSALRSTIHSACTTMICLPDPSARDPFMAQAYQSFGLTDAEIDILANAEGKRDYYYRSTKGRRLFRLDLGPVALALVAMTNDQEFLTALLEQDLTPEQRCQCIFERRSIPWPVDPNSVHGSRVYQS